jgi:4-amino-4-deoxy-L-arabinose transferase-like glycosyltransferase
MPINQRFYLSLIVFFHLIYLPLIYLMPYYTKGEPREALVARAMMTEDNYILPMRLEGEYATKPPMTHWLISLSSLLTGHVSEGASRLPSLLLSLITCLTLFKIITKRHGTTLAGATTLTLLASVEWHRTALMSRVDMTFSCLLILSLLSFFCWNEKRSNLKIWLTVLLLAMSTLTKGPAAIILFIGIAGSYLLLTKNSFTRSALVCARIATLTAAISLLWYGLAVAYGGDRFIETILLENFARFTGKMSQTQDPHSHSVWYLYGTLWVGLFPFIIPLTIRFFSAVRQYKFQFSVRKSLSSLDSRCSLPLLSLLATLIVLAFFSIPESKRSVYLLPLYPFAAFLITRVFLADLKLTKLLQRTIYTFSGVLLIIIITLLCGAFLDQQELLTTLPTKLLAILKIINIPLLTLALLLTIMALLFITLKIRSHLTNQSEHGSTLLIPQLSFLVILVGANYGLILPYSQNFTGKYFAAEISERISAQHDWHYFEVDPYALTVYLPSTGHRLDLKKHPAKTGDLILTNEQGFEKLKLLLKKFKLLELKRSKQMFLKKNSHLILLEVKDLL